MKTTATLALALGTTLLAASPAQASATKVAAAIWVDGELYGTVLTPTSFRTPPPQSTDPLYNFMMSGLEGQRAVGESAPGDPSYNGGRWDVQLVIFTETGLAYFDGDGDGRVDSELTSVEDLLEHEALGHLEITSAGFYFVCPLIP